MQPYTYRHRLRIMPIVMVFAALCMGRDATSAATESVHLSHADLSALAPFFAEVRIHLKRSKEETSRTRPFFDWVDEDGASSMMYQSYITEKKPLKLTGIVMAPDVVLTADTILNQDYVDYIEVADLRGRVSKAERLALLAHTPGLLVKVLEPEQLAIAPVPFDSPPAPFTAESTAVLVGPNEFNGWYALSSTPLTYAVQIAHDQAAEGMLMAGPIGGSVPSIARAAFSLLETAARGARLVLGEECKPLGVALTAALPAEPGKPPFWLGGDLMADKRIPFDELEAVKGRLKSQFEAAMPEIRITFRQPAKERGAGLPMFSPEMLFDQAGGAVPNERYFYGLPVSPGLLFVPERIPREHAKVIDEISVACEGRRVPGQFAGAFEDIAAFLVRAEGELPAAPVNWSADAALPRFVPIMGVKAERKYGGKHVQVAHTRVSRLERGYKDILEPVPMGDQSIGTLYCDQAGAVIALLLEQRKEDEAKEQLTEAFDPYSIGAFAKFIRVYTAAELSGHFGAPDARFDETIVALSEEEEHRKMWLGVEYEPMTKELAESMAIEKPTKEGAIGLVLSTIYPDSPAEGLGLRTGDILLKIQEPGEKEPTELRAGEEYRDPFGGMDFELPAGLDTFGFDMPPMRQWRSRDNFLTRLLGAVGEDKQAELTYLAGGTEERTVQFTVERAPADFDGAPKFKDEEVGLTVKDLTYEVRNALMLPESFNAVVVAKVEEGSPAAVARVGVYDLILKIGNTEISGVGTFEELVKTAEEQKEQDGEATLRFTLQRLGKTRFADLILE